MLESKSIFECKTLPAFNHAFARLSEIHLYAVLAVADAFVSAMQRPTIMQVSIPVLTVALGYPFFEYALHRLLLHGTYLCKTEMTARVWWRIHYRHHVNPRDSDVIMAAPWTLLVAVATGALLAAATWWSWAGFAASLAASFVAAIVYEYFHALDHGRVELRPGYLLRMRQHHIAHHYFNERGNYGIVTSIIDGLLKTFLVPSPTRSPTVHNLGYRDELAAHYPYIERLERERGNAPQAPTPDMGS